MTSRIVVKYMSNDWLQRKLIFIIGKGGVGKTTIANAAARTLARRQKRTLLVRLLQVENKEQKLELTEPNLWEITLDSNSCFKEYIGLKLKIKALATFLIGNKVMQYFEKAAPGVREMVLLGKIWYERAHYDHIVVDMPSTGYALTMVHTPKNFASLFPGGPIHHDADIINGTFNNPNESAFVIVTLPEEMPIQESYDLSKELHDILPDNPAHLVVNRARAFSSKAYEFIKEWRPKKSKSLERSQFWKALTHNETKVGKQAHQLKDLENEWRRSWISIHEVKTISDDALVEEAVSVLAK